ncbi:MAG: hypothetical protein HQ503_02985 [Rhodospirillales bacterium]|nr:hypothetical protein [Rhodospirillales bacterium]
MSAFKSIPVIRNVCTLFAAAILASCSQSYVEELPLGNVQKTLRADMTPKGVILSVPGCPDWTEDTRTTYANGVHSNFGCADATNLGMMVVNPNDVWAGRKLGPADGAYSVGAIERYRKGKTTPLLTGSSATGESAPDDSAGATSKGGS